MRALFSIVEKVGDLGGGEAREMICCFKSKPQR